jgi:phage tail sheath protein FI
MPEYLSPGVYVEEVASGPRPIEGVGTSTAGFVGLTERGPTLPRLVTSWGEFLRWFGDTIDPLVSLMPFGVRGFFDNGGQRAFIARVVGNGSTDASVDIPTPGANTALRIVALGPGVWGNRILVRITPASQNAAPPANWFRLTLAYYANGIPTPFVDPLNPANRSNPFRREPDLLEDYDNLASRPGRSNSVEAVVNAASKLVQVTFARDPALLDLATANPNTVLRISARAPGAAGNAFTVAVANGTNANTFQIIVDDGTGATQTFDNIPDANPNQAVAAVNASPIVQAAFRAVNQANPAPPARPNNAAATNLAGGGPTVPGRPQDRAFDAGIAFADLATANANTALRISARAPGAAANAFTVAVVNGTNPNTFRINLNDGAAQVFDNIPDNDPGQVIGLVSALPTVRADWFPTAPPNPAQPARPNNAAAANLAGGGLGSGLVGGGNGNAATPAEFIGNPAVPPDQRTGLAGLATIDEVNMLVAPDEVNGNIANAFQITAALVAQAELLQERFAILSIPQGQGLVQNIQPPQDSTYGAVYYPWIRVFDARIQDTLLIPPAGHVAGIYARTDIERGVHKAPANEVVRGIVNQDLGPTRKPLEFQIVKGEHDILNPRGVNVIRDFRPDGRGIRVWGARTMSSDPLWKYVSVRRLFLFLRESIDEGTQWVVFEPNDDALWARVRQVITNFLTSVWRSGALQGLTADEAFFVRCGRDTMTQDDIDSGRLICEIGVAPVKPAEFVIFRIQQKTLVLQA